MSHAIWNASFELDILGSSIVQHMVERVGKSKQVGNYYIRPLGEVWKMNLKLVFAICFNSLSVRI